MPGVVEQAVGDRTGERGMLTRVAPTTPSRQAKNELTPIFPRLTNLTFLNISGNAVGHATWDEVRRVLNERRYRDPLWTQRQGEQRPGRNGGREI
jgi:hypothetical protein